MELLKEFKEKGIKIKLISNDKLWLGPREKLTPELIAKAKEHKAELIKTLQEVKPQSVHEAININDYLLLPPDKQKKYRSQDIRAKRQHICVYCSILDANGFCFHWKQYPPRWQPIYSCPYFQLKENFIKH